MKTTENVIEEILENRRLIKELTMRLAPFLALGPSAVEPGTSRATTPVQPNPYPNPYHPDEK